MAQTAVGKSNSEGKEAKDHCDKLAEVLCKNYLPDRYTFNIDNSTGHLLWFDYCDAFGTSITRVFAEPDFVTGLVVLSRDTSLARELSKALRTMVDFGMD